VLYFCNDANMNVTALTDAATGGVEERKFSPDGLYTISEQV
jgi:hypothetical protein